MIQSRPGWGSQTREEVGMNNRKNHGTLTNNPTWVKTNKGWALDFDGNGASVAVYDRALSSEEIRQLYADREEE